MIPQVPVSELGNVNNRKQCDYIVYGFTNIVVNLKLESLNTAYTSKEWILHACIRNWIINTQHMRMSDS